MMKIFCITALALSAIKAAFTECDKLDHPAFDNGYGRGFVPLKENILGVFTDVDKQTESFNNNGIKIVDKAGLKDYLEANKKPIESIKINDEILKAFETQAKMIEKDVTLDQFRRFNSKDEGLKFRCEEYYGSVNLNPEVLESLKKDCQMFEKEFEKLKSELTSNQNALDEVLKELRGDQNVAKKAENSEEEQKIEEKKEMEIKNNEMENNEIKNNKTEKKKENDEKKTKEKPFLIQENKEDDFEQKQMILELTKKK